jgi:hypothetical protein
VHSNGRTTGFLRSFRVASASRCRTDRRKPEEVVWRAPEIAGTYVVTTNAEAAQAFSLPESVDAKFFPYGTPIEVVRAAHEARLEATIQRTGSRPTSMTTIEDVFALETRLKQCKNAHRAASNWVTQNELRAASGGNTALADAIFKEVQTVLAESS